MGKILNSIRFRTLYPWWRSFSIQ